MTDKLPPEVAEALERLDANRAVECAGVTRLSRQPFDAVFVGRCADYDAIRAHLHSLTDENARLRSMYGKCREDWVAAWNQNVALRKRIAEAMHYTVPKVKPKDAAGWATVIESVKNLDALRGKTLALVVVEDAAHD